MYRLKAKPIEIGPAVDAETAAEYLRIAATTDDPEVAKTLRSLADPNQEWYDAAEVLNELALRDLAEARKAKGWTQKDLGERLGLPQSRISTIERHPERVSGAMLEKIANVLGVTLFIGERGGPKAA